MFQCLRHLPRKKSQSVEKISSGKRNNEIHHWQIIAKYLLQNVMRNCGETAIGNVFWPHQIILSLSSAADGTTYRHGSKKLGTIWWLRAALIRSRVDLHKPCLKYLGETIDILHISIQHQWRFIAQQVGKTQRYFTHNPDSWTFCQFQTAVLRTYSKSSEVNNYVPGTWFASAVLKNLDHIFQNEHARRFPTVSWKQGQRQKELCKGQKVQVVCLSPALATYSRWYGLILRPGKNLAHF